MIIDDGVTSESTLVNIRLSSESVPVWKLYIMFSDSDIIKL